MLHLNLEKNRHLMDWKYWPENAIFDLMNLARKIKQNRWEYQGLMQGNTLAMIFQKTSTRTRISFEVSMTEMGGHAIYIDWISSNFILSDIQLETQYLSRNVAFILARLKSNADLMKMAEVSDVPVINGCCNLYHPCQSLADLLTILLDRGSLEGAKIAYVGVYNNVVNSLVSLSAVFGVHLTLVCPVKEKEVVDQESLDKLKKKGLVKETLDLKAALVGQDYVYTDTWVDMEFFLDPAFQHKKEERVNLMLPYQLNKKNLAGFGGKIMHDMPIHDGYEITKEMVNDPRSIIFTQAENRLEVQKALLITLKSYGK